MAKKCTTYKLGGAVVGGGLGAVLGRLAGNKWGYKISTTIPWGTVGLVGGGLIGAIPGYLLGRKAGKCSR